MNRLLALLATARTGVVSFWRWWTAELDDSYRDWVAPRLQPNYRSGSIKLSAHQIQFRVSQRGATKTWTLDRLTKRAEIAQQIVALIEQAEGRFDQLDIWLAPDLVLNRTLRFPDAIKAHLQSVVGLQLGRLTPFYPEEVHFVVRAVDGDAPAGRFDAVLTVLPKRFTAPLIEIADRQSKSITIRTTPSIPGEPAMVMVRHRVQSLPVEARRMERGLAIAAVCLLVATLAVSAGRLMARQADIDERIAAVSLQAKQSEKLVAALERQQEQLRDLVAKLGQPSRALALAELSELMPLNSWVTQLQWQGEKLQVAGETLDSSALVAAINLKSEFSDITLRSTAVPGEAHGERFDISLKTKSARPE